jgi:hypothetical protein
VRDFQGIAGPAKRRLEAINRRPSARRPFDNAVKSVGEAEGKLEGIFLNSDQRSVARYF